MGESEDPRARLLERSLTWFGEHGVGETSLRTLAAGVGSSHRMVIYHFGSRAGLLAAVVDAMARRQLSDLDGFLRSDGGDAREVAWRTWTRLADDATVFAPLFFELSSQAMVGRSWAAQLRELVAGGERRLMLFFERLGHPPVRAAMLGRTAMALSRGVVFELALTGDRRSADEVMRAFLDGAFTAERPVGDA